MTVSSSYSVRGCGDVAEWRQSAGRGGSREVRGGEGWLSCAGIASRVVAVEELSACCGLGECSAFRRACVVESPVVQCGVLSSVILRVEWRSVDVP